MDLDGHSLGLFFSCWRLRRKTRLPSSPRPVDPTFPSPPPLPSPLRPVRHTGEYKNKEKPRGEEFYSFGRVTVWPVIFLLSYPTDKKETVKRLRPLTGPLALKGHSKSLPLSVMDNTFPASALARIRPSAVSLHRLQPSRQEKNCSLVFQPLGGDSSSTTPFFFPYPLREWITVPSVLHPHTHHRTRRYEGKTGTSTN